MAISIALALSLACTKEVEVPGETVVVEKEVIKEVEVPGETVVVEKVVVEEVEVPGETVVVEKEVVKEVEVPGETVVVEKEVVKEVEVPGETVVVEKVVEVEAEVPAYKAVDLARYGGTLKVAGTSSILTLDCMFACAGVTMAVTDHIYERMFGHDADVVAQPIMVDTWDVTDGGATWTFTLRDGMKFQDGEPVTAADAVQSFFRASPDIASGVFLSERLASLEAIDRLTLRLELTEPLGFVIDGLATPWPQFNVLPERIAQISTDEDIGEANVIGSGPYRLKEWLRGNRIVIERFEDFLPRTEPSSGLYGTKHAYLDEIVYLEIPSMQTKIAGLETEQWDVVEDAALDFYDQLKRNDDVAIEFYRFAQSKMPLNTELAPTNNKLVRQAVQAAVDVDFFMNAFAPKELWQLCPAQYYCGTGLETYGGADLYDQGDIERARDLLAQAGYAGETFTIINPTDLASVGWMGQVAKPVFEQAGITVEMPSIDWATVQSIIATPNSDWNMSTTWYALWTTPNPVADTVPAGLQWGGSNWDVQGAKDLQYAYAQELDYDKQLAIIDELQVLLRTEVKEITLGQWSSITPHRTEVKGIIVPTMAIYFNAWIDD